MNKALSMGVIALHSPLLMFYKCSYASSFSHFIWLSIVPAAFNIFHGEKTTTVLLLFVLEAFKYLPPCTTHQTVSYTGQMWRGVPAQRRRRTGQRTWERARSLSSHPTSPAPLSGPRWTATPGTNTLHLATSVVAL